jgi:hypothetical protein
MKASRRAAVERDASRHWLWRSLDDLLVVAWVAACFGAAVAAVAAGVPVLREAIALGLVLVLTLVIVQYSRHTGRRP